MQIDRKNPPPFGSVFAETMPISRFKNGTWEKYEIVPSNQLTMHPAMHVLHYGSACFEGMKAFRQAGDKIFIFRLDDHIKRLQVSAEILNLPIPDADLSRQMIIEAVKNASEIVPDPTGSLYIRPTLFGIDENIGKAGVASETAMFYVLTSPVGDYFKFGSPMKILIDKEHGRCAPHMGRVKAGGNYASALAWQVKAKNEYGANQVLFCPNNDVQETGASNFMLIDGKKIITKALSDAFLHGITRKSVLAVAPNLGFTVEERDFTVEEILDVVNGGGEAILTGTAAVISPVTAFIFEGQEVAVQSQEKALQLRQAILDIQFGQAPDAFNWLTAV